MTRTDLRLDLPTGSWLGDVSRAVPEATLRVAETLATGDGAGETVATVLVAGTERDRVGDALRDHDRVERVTTVERRGDARTLRVGAREPVYLPAARAVELPIESGITVDDGRATLTVIGDRSRVEAFGRRLTADGITVGVAATAGDDPDRTLTEAQRDLVFAAVEAGYYDTPRECTLTELAEAHDIAKSTCSETLHRAEGRVLRRFVDGEVPFDAAATAEGPGSSGDAASAEPSRDEFEAADRDGDEPVRSAATEP